MDYRHSPHLAQWALRDRLTGVLRRAVHELPAGLPLRVLEVGAGHGGYTDQLLAAGCEVTVAELWRPSLRELEAIYGTNRRLSTVFAPDGDLSAEEGSYALVLCVSVLHHLPDYLGFVDRLTRRLLPGGTLLTLQDPLWYPRVGRVTRTVDRWAYLAWRSAQGNVAQGLAALRRRLAGVCPEARSGEIVYYHVVRQRVDEQAVAGLLSKRFTEVDVSSYWSHHLAAIRRPADWTGLVNTFSVRSTGFLRVTVACRSP